MNKVLVTVIMLIVSLLAGACAKDGGDSTQKQDAESLKQNNTSEHTSSLGLAEVLKEQKLLNFSSTTIGNAFDSYRFFDKREWSETQAPNKKTYVDFIGWFKKNTFDVMPSKNGISARGVEVKFVINPGGSFFVGMVSKVEITADGKINRYPLPDIKGILTKIYANKEITF